MKRATLIVAGLIVSLLAAFALFIVVGSRWSAAQVERDWRQMVPQPVADIGSSGRLVVLPLYEEAGDSARFSIGHGLSYLLQVDEGSILLDVGIAPSAAEPLPLAANMAEAGVRPDEIDVLAFSHFHADHSGSMDAWRQGQAYLGGLEAALGQIAVIVPARFVVGTYSPLLAKEPVPVLPGVVTSGAIQFAESFPISLYQRLGAEQALIVHVQDKGLVLITGCGHPTIERLVSRAKALSDEPIIGIIGGLHSDGLSSQEIQADIEFLQSEGVRFVAVSPHDSDEQALDEYAEAFSEGYLPIRVGEPIIIK